MVDDKASRGRVEPSFFLQHVKNADGFVGLSAGGLELAQAHVLTPNKP